MNANYYDKLKDPRWQRKRLEIMSRDNFQCRYCNDKETTLQVHHLKYNNEPWQANNDELITVCEHCHFCIESLKKINIVLKAADKVKIDSGYIIFLSDGVSFGHCQINFDNTHIFFYDSFLMQKIDKLINRAKNG